MLSSIAISCSQILPAHTVKYCRGFGSTWQPNHSLPILSRSFLQCHVLQSQPVISSSLVVELAVFVVSSRRLGYIESGCGMKPRSCSFGKGFRYYAASLLCWRSARASSKGSVLVNLPNYFSGPHVPPLLCEGGWVGGCCLRACGGG